MGRRGALAVLVLLALWAFAPTTILIEHALSNDLKLTGADGFFPGDQLQYMAWIREHADHLLASNQFDTAAGDRVFLHPLFFISGLAVKLGVSIQVAVLAWKPVAIVVLFAGFAAYVRRHLGLDRPAGVVALALALFLFVPLGLLLDWTGVVEGEPTSQLTAFGSVLFLSDELWGEPHLAMAAGLMPVFLILAAAARVG